MDYENLTKATTNFNTLNHSISQWKLFALYYMPLPASTPCPMPFDYVVSHFLNRMLAKFKASDAQKTYQKITNAKVPKAKHKTSNVRFGLAIAPRRKSNLDP